MVVLLVTSAVFTLIRFPTSAVSLGQAMGWLLGGLMLGAAYWLSGSLWVAIAIHFVTDLLDVLVLNILGRTSVFAFAPPLRAVHRTFFRAIFRAMQAVVTTCLLLLFYGITLHTLG